MFGLSVHKVYVSHDFLPYFEFHEYQCKQKLRSYMDTLLGLL